MIESTTVSHTRASGCGPTPRRRTSRYLPGHHKPRHPPRFSRLIPLAPSCLALDVA